MPAAQRPALQQLACLGLAGLPSVACHQAIGPGEDASRRPAGRRAPLTRSQQPPLAHGPTSWKRGQSRCPQKSGFFQSSLAAAAAAAPAQTSSRHTANLMLRLVTLLGVRQSNVEAIGEGKQTPQPARRQRAQRRRQAPLALKGVQRVTWSLHIAGACIHTASTGTTAPQLARWRRPSAAASAQPAGPRSSSC